MLLPLMGILFLLSIPNLKVSAQTSDSFTKIQCPNCDVIISSLLVSDDDILQYTTNHKTGIYDLNAKKECDSTKPTKLTIDTSNAVWWQQGNSIKKTKKKGTLISSASIPDSLLSSAVRLSEITTDKKNNLWFSTNQGILERKGNKWIHYTTTNSPLLCDTVNFIAVAPDNTKWIVTKLGINLLNDSSGNLKWDSLNDPNYPAFFYTKSTTFDESGRAWLGTWHGKLIRYDRGILDTPEVFKNNTIESTLPISQLVFDVYGNLWAGTWGRGLLKISPDGTTYKAYTIKNSILSSSFINRMYAASDSCIYEVGKQIRLDVYNRWGERIRRSYFYPESDGMGNGAIRWDGNNDKGYCANIGVYQVMVYRWPCHDNSDNGQLLKFPTVVWKRKNWFSRSYSTIEDLNYMQVQIVN